ncbi:hypothetical protein CWC05_09260 [Pseudoalteromonas ruthenica]|uniref:IrrE N-terminal-like domain-containing protein n=1 Tax=Pseudoalteromonas ruthenica TaxID=151081 RepID=A0A5S3Z4R1_9GAMM|nr:ImmA/IrrE family metallo-endopeptidase [Pseudoalteromonas ruthenica]TMP87269.1 hypothetical protein CWC05_09260 [Pseudoalteromonas ruthenica]
MTNSRGCEELGPKKWAYKLTHILDATLGSARFPIDVPLVAKEITKTLFPDDPITLVKGAELEDFEGALFKAPERKKGWGIIYNSALTSEGRINFTLAHEFGHYLLHRKKYPEGIQCSERELLDWKSEIGRIEGEANEFASNFLMPLNDFKEIISPTEEACRLLLGEAADRYNTSFTATTLRWLAYTEKKAVLVVSRDGFILWAWSSKSAYKAGYYIKTNGLAPKSLPKESLAAQIQPNLTVNDRVLHKSNVWFDNSSIEHCFNSEQYDLVISIIYIP